MLTPHSVLCLECQRVFFYGNYDNAFIESYIKQVTVYCVQITCQLHLQSCIAAHLHISINITCQCSVCPHNNTVIISALIWNPERSSSVFKCVLFLNLNKMLSCFLCSCRLCWPPVINVELANSLYPTDPQHTGGHFNKSSSSSISSVWSCATKSCSNHASWSVRLYVIMS